MSKTNNFVFWGLYTVAWLIFVGLSIEAGGLIVNFFFSLYKPEFVQNLYQKLDLTEIYKGRFHIFQDVKPAFCFNLMVFPSSLDES